MSTRISVLAALAATSLVLVGCAADPTASTDSSHFNDADVEFLTGMIPHHAQALLMVDMTDGRELTPEFAALTEDIESAQGPEIDQMSALLEQWGHDVPESPARMGMMTGDDGMGMMMGGDFEDMWMRMMIEHHEGAIDMSRIELAAGVNADVRDLARRIIAAQEAEITVMEELLADER